MFNKNTTSFFFLFVLFINLINGQNIKSTNANCTSELIISEYIEGSSNNKFLELFNDTGIDINLSNYELRKYTNGSSTVSNTLTLGGILANGQTYVIANSSQNLGVIADLSTNNAVMIFNGDDAIELFNTNTNLPVDIIGQIGMDPGTEWGTGLTSTNDNSLVRKSSVISGDTDGTNVFDPSIEWDGFAIDDVSHLGSHTINCAPCLEPTTQAAFWLSSPVNVTTTSVTLNWTNGDGQNRIALLSTNPITFNPLDNTTYSSNSTFGSGTDLGNNTFVIYNGNSNTIDVTGLTPGTFYYTKIFEYNCNIGNEDYLISGTPTMDSFYTNPNNPETFNKVCSTNNSIDLQWTAPLIGNFDGYLLVVREGNTPHSVNTTDPSSILTTNLDYSLAGTYGSTLLYSRYLVIGTATNVTVTGLSQGVNYTFELFTYTDNGIDFAYSSGMTTTQTINLDNVSSEIGTAGNTQATINWTNPNFNCYDEILVVINQTNGIDFSPVGDGTQYTPNTIYTNNNQVVLLGTGNTVSVTNLVNGVTYYFEIFVRNGTTWSTGIEVAVTPNTQTIFNPGDLVIVGYDNLAGGANDAITILTMVDIAPNTTFWYSNASYEIGAAPNVRTKQWRSCSVASNEAIGTQQLTYLGPDILPSGSTFCMLINGNNQILGSDIIAHPSVGTGTFNFSNGFTPAGFLTSVNISTTNPDAIFLMQGSWSGDLGGYRTFDGVILGGIQDGGNWYTVADDLSGTLTESQKRRSRIPPEIQCFAIQGTTSSTSGFAYYNGTKNDSKVALLQNISDFTNNWVQGAGDNTNNISATSCDATYIFSISGTATPGIWTNAKNDNNWFNCGNWENLTVPNEVVNVTINNISGSDFATIDITALDADIYNYEATCKNLTINGEKVVLESSTNNILKIFGDLNITNGVLDMDDNDITTADGYLFLNGNWTNSNEANFLQGNGTVHFNGLNTQNILCNSGTQTEIFYNLTLENSFTTNNFNSDIEAEGTLEIKTGKSLLVKANHYASIKKNIINNGLITVENQGSLIQVDNVITDTNLGNGNYTIHKSTTPYVMYDYTYWSSPIKTANIASIFSASPTGYVYYFNPQNFSDEFSGNGYPQILVGADSHDDTGDDWISASGNMTPGKGYAIMGEGAVFPFTTPTATTYIQNVQFDGKVNNGLVEIPVYLDLYNTTNGSGNSFNKNDNFIGNPYPSAIDANILLTENTNLGGTIYFWTHDSVIGSGSNIGPDAYNFTNDDYASWNSLGGTAAHAGNPVPTGKIASGQGFFVTATVNETIHFNNNMRVKSGNDLFFRTNRIWLNLTNDNGLFRQILIGFDANATDGIDRLYDGLRMENGTNYDFYSLVENEKMAIQGLAPFDEEKIIPLGFENIQAGDFKININHFETDFDNTNIYLKDNLLNVIHNLKQNEYPFTENRLGNINDRFELIFQKNNLHTDFQNQETSSLIVSNQNVGFLIQILGNKSIQKVFVYDVLGKLITKINTNNNQIELKQDYQTGSVYFIKVILENGIILTEKIIKF